MKATITQASLRELLAYDPATGIFQWRASGTGHRWHNVAGSRNKHDGYVKIYVKPHRYAAHQLAWLYMTGDVPNMRLDHVNGVRHDNRFANLRLATSHQNAWNHKVPRTSKSGVSGVHFARERGGQWIALLKLPHKMLRKRFKSLDAAISQRRAWETEHHGEFAASKRMQ